jgi:sugar lactone lactonase YvrE
VGFFTNIPYREGAAAVVRVSADGTVTEAWSGLTLITALAVGPDDALYALEMATGIDPEDPDSIAPGSGRVVRLGEGGAIEEVVTGLALPVSMAFGPDGALYVGGPTFGADQGQGTIVRIDLAGGGTGRDAGGDAGRPALLTIGPAVPRGGGHRLGLDLPAVRPKNRPRTDRGRSPSPSED